MNAGKISVLLHHFSKLDTEWQQLIIVIVCFLVLVWLASTLLVWAWKSKIKRYASIAVILSSIILIGYGMYSSIIDDYERDLQNAGYVIGPSGEMVKSSAWSSGGSILRVAGRAVKKLFGAGDDLKKVDDMKSKSKTRPEAKPEGKGRHSEVGGPKPALHTSTVPDEILQHIENVHMRRGGWCPVDAELAGRIARREVVLQNGALIKNLDGSWFIQASGAEKAPVVVDMSGRGVNLVTHAPVAQSPPTRSTPNTVLDSKQFEGARLTDDGDWYSLVAAEERRLGTEATKARAAALKKIDPEVQNFAKEMQQEAGQPVPALGSGAPTAPHPGTSDPARPWFDMNHKSNLQKTHNLGDEAFEGSADGAGYRLTEAASKELRDRGKLAAQPAGAATSTRPKPESQAANPFINPTTQLPSQAAASAPGAPTMIRIPKAEYDSLAKQYPGQLSPSASSSKTIFVDTRRLPASDPLYMKIREKECGSDGRFIHDPATQTVPPSAPSTPNGVNPAAPGTGPGKPAPPTSTTPAPSSAPSSVVEFRHSVTEEEMKLLREVSDIPADHFSPADGGRYYVDSRGLTQEQIVDVEGLVRAHSSPFTQPTSQLPSSAPVKPTAPVKGVPEKPVAIGSRASGPKPPEAPQVHPNAADTANTGHLGGDSGINSSQTLDSPVQVDGISTASGGSWLPSWNGTLNVYDKITGAVTAPIRVALSPFADDLNRLGRFARKFEDPRSTAVLSGSSRVSSPVTNRIYRGAATALMGNEILTGGPIDYWQNAGTWDNLTSDNPWDQTHGGLQVLSGMIPFAELRRQLTRKGLDCVMPAATTTHQVIQAVPELVASADQTMQNVSDTAQNVAEFTDGLKNAVSMPGDPNTSPSTPGTPPAQPAAVETPFNAFNNTVATTGEKIAPGFGKLPYRSALAGTAIGGLSGGVVGALRYALQDKSLLTKEERKKRSLSRLIASNAGVGAALGGITGGLLDVRNAL